jgi:hypothetical protein
MIELKQTKEHITLNVGGVCLLKVFLNTSYANEMNVIKSIFSYLKHHYKDDSNSVLNIIGNVHSIHHNIGIYRGETNFWSIAFFIVDKKLENYNLEEVITLMKLELGEN